MFFRNSDGKPLRTFPGLVLSEQILDEHGGFRDESDDHERGPKSNHERPNGPDHLADRHLADSAAEIERGTDRWGVKADGRIQKHDDAELDRIHAVMRDDGQEDRRANQDMCGHVEKYAEDEQRYVDQDEDHPWLRADMAERLADHVGDPINAHQITEHRRNADQQQHHARGLGRLCHRLQKVFEG